MARLSAFSTYAFCIYHHRNRVLCEFKFMASDNVFCYCTSNYVFGLVIVYILPLSLGKQQLVPYVTKSAGMVVMRVTRLLKQKLGSM